MDSALTLHSWCMAAGERRSPEGTCRAVASPAGTGRLSQFLGKGQMCGDRGGTGLLGVQWVSLAPCGKAQGFVLSLPACLGGCWLPQRATGVPVDWPCPQCCLGNRSLLQCGELPPALGRPQRLPGEGKGTRHLSDPMWVVWQQR